MPGGATHVRPSRPRPAVCSSATARQTSGVPSPSHARTTSLVDPTRSKRSRRERKDRMIAPAQPAAAAPASTASGRSSSKASCSARRAVSRSASAIMHVIRTSEVEIISMLTPASASVPNMRAA